MSFFQQSNILEEYPKYTSMTLQWDFRISRPVFQQVDTKTNCLVRYLNFVNKK